MYGAVEGVGLACKDDDKWEQEELTLYLYIKQPVLRRVYPQSILKDSRQLQAVLRLTQAPAASICIVQASLRYP